MITYLPSVSSPWLLFVRPGRVLLTASSLTDASIAALWLALDTPDPVQSVLDRLTERGLTSTPAFVIAHWSGEAPTPLQLVVRGELVVEVTAGSTVERVDAVGVSTWRELSVDAASEFSCTTATTATGVDAVALPLDSGVVPGSSVTVPLASGPRAVSVAASGTVATESGTTVATEPSDSVATAPSIPVVPPEPSAPEPSDRGPSGSDQTGPEHTVQEQTVQEQTMVEAPASSEVTSAIPEETYSHLFEETIVRSIEDAAVRPDEESDDDVPAVGGDDDEGDHDGLTMMSGDLAELRARRGANPTDAPALPAAPTIVLERESGSIEALAQPVLVGRSPSVSKVSSGQVPRLIAITGNPDISRNHAQFALEGDTVVVTDLHSRNGTSIVLPGKSPQLLRQGEPTAVIVGTLIDLGGGITFTVREQA